jgi:hypothetical protein
MPLRFLTCVQLVDAKTRRAVKYTKTLELWESSQAQRRLPVQWKMWLTHTRSQPPTPEVRLAVRSPLGVLMSARRLRS